MATAAAAGRDLIERAQALGRIPEAPRLRMGTVREFFERVEREVDDDLPVWNDEIYPTPSRNADKPGAHQAGQPQGRGAAARCGVPGGLRRRVPAERAWMPNPGRGVAAALSQPVPRHPAGVSVTAVQAVADAARTADLGAGVRDAA